MILEYYLCIAICDGKFNSDYWLSCVLKALGCYGLCYNKVNEVTIETIWIRRSWLVKCFFFSVHCVLPRDKNDVFARRQMATAL